MTERSKTASPGVVDQPAVISGFEKSPDPAIQSLGPDWLTLIAFAAFIVLVAGNVVAVRVSNLELPPFWGATIRFAVAAVLFLAYMAYRKLPLPHGRALLGPIIFGVLQFGAGFAFAYWALQEVPAGLASVILASVPLFTLVFAILAGQERLRIRGVLGSLSALAGIAVLFGDRTDISVPTAHMLAVLGAAACFALAPVVVKSFKSGSQAGTNAVGMLVGFGLLLTLSSISGEPQRLPQMAGTWAAYLYLVTLGSVGVFGLLLFLLERWTASAVSYQAVLSPVIAIGLSAWLLDEPVTGGLLLGGGLVLVGVYLGALGSEG